VPYELQWEPEGVVKRFWGELSDGEIAASLAKIGADERFDALRYTISDLLEVRNVGALHVELEELGALDFAHALSNPRLQVAIVAGDEATMALLREAINRAGGPLRYGVFSSIEEARRWIKDDPGPAFRARARSV